MKNFISSFLIFILFSLVAFFGLKQCKGDSSSKKNDSEVVFKDDYSSILKDYKTWSEYNKHNIELAYDFIPFDVNGAQIDKTTFLNQLKTGNFIPVKSDGEAVAYKLIDLQNKEIEPKIGKASKGIASSALYYYQKEGQVFPEFDFTDLNGISYTSESLKGKILVFKCWFIRCKICVQEFPELNVLYDKFEGNDKVEFISVAFDKEDQLKEFLADRPFRYPVIAEQQKFIMKEIGAKQFPLHVIVGEDGKVIKMVNKVETLIHYLDELTD